MSDSPAALFGTLLDIMARLRGPGGCPWDREQTPSSLKPFLIEETYEVLEAIETDDAPALSEELGDLLFQVVFHARIAEERAQNDWRNGPPALDEQVERAAAQGQLVQEHDDAGANQHLRHDGSLAAGEAIAQRDHRAILKGDGE